MNNTSVLVPSAMPELLASIAVITVAFAAIVLTLVVIVPDLYREAKTWFPKTEVDQDARRRELGRIAAPGHPHRRVH